MALPIKPILLKILETFKEDPIVHSDLFKEYASKENILRGKFLLFASAFLTLNTTYTFFHQDIYLNQYYLLSIVTMCLFSITIIILITKLKLFQKLVKRFPGIAVIVIWVGAMLLDTPTFLIDVRTTHLTMNISTWLAGMAFLLVITRRQIVVVYSCFLLWNYALAFYAQAPFFFYTDLTARIILVAIIVYFWQYPHTISTINNIRNSRTDPLTGLLNRREGLRQTAFLLQSNIRNNKHTVIYMMDIDNFKIYNDSYGHQAGDFAIQMVSQALRDVFSRTNDVIIRYGGEEFMLCIGLDTPDSAALMAQKLHKHIPRLWVQEQSEKNYPVVTVSVGYVLVPTEKIVHDDIDTWIHAADKALYQAKAKGKNGSVCFST